MTARVKKDVDASRFEGEGLNFKAKLIGVETVSEARGDQMCQESLVRLKNEVKNSGEHKQKIVLNVSLEGLKIVDPIAMKLLHSHAVHHISFITRDVSDGRAFGYIFGEGGSSHQFFAIKTAAAAEHVVIAIRDLFQTVYDLKKQEMEEAKEKLEKGDQEENLEASRNGSTSGNGEAQKATATADGDGIYQVPPNNAPVKTETSAEQAANLLDLEDQAEAILKGIEQIKNLDFDSLRDETPGSPVSPPTSPLAQLAPPPSGTSDPWGVPASSAATQAPATGGGSALGDLAGLQTSPFPTMPGTGFPPMQQPGFGMPAQQPGFRMPGQPGVSMPPMGLVGGGLPVTKDPFANDPFSPTAATQARPQGQMPFGGNAFGVPQPGMPAMGMAPMGTGSAALPPQFPGQIVGGVPNPFLQQPPAQMTNAFAEEPKLLQPMRDDNSTTEESAFTNDSVSSKKQNDLFGDLVDIKKSAPANAKNPKDMFKQINAAEKKSLNDIKKQTTASQASSFGDAFGSN